MIPIKPTWMDLAMCQSLAEPEAGPAEKPTLTLSVKVPKLTIYETLAYTFLEFQEEEPCQCVDYDEDDGL